MLIVRPSPVEPPIDAELALRPIEGSPDRREPLTFRLARRRHELRPGGLGFDEEPCPVGTADEIPGLRTSAFGPEPLPLFDDLLVIGPSEELESSNSLSPVGVRGKSNHAKDEGTSPIAFATAAVEPRSIARRDSAEGGPHSRIHLPDDPCGNDLSRNGRASNAARARSCTERAHPGGVTENRRHCVADPRAELSPCRAARRFDGSRTSLGTLGRERPRVVSASAAAAGGRNDRDRA